VGYFLVDATYNPVNHCKSSINKRNAIVLSDYPNLIADLKKITGARRTEIILVKANICRLLENMLLKDGFNVINNGVVVYFPSTGQQNKFKEQIESILPEKKRKMYFTP